MFYRGINSKISSLMLAINQYLDNGAISEKTV